MKLLARIAIPVVTVLLSAPAFAAIDLGGGADYFTLHFDENGNGTASVNGGTPYTIHGSLMADASNGGRMDLTYLLPQSPVGNGDLLVYDGTTLSDVVRFTDAAGHLTGTTANELIFYSLTGGGDPADTGLPSNAGTGASASVMENPDGSFAYLLGPTNENYYGQSSLTPTPEPSAWIMLLTAVTATGFIYRKRFRVR